MVFGQNVLHIEHKNGWGIEFHALDALKSMMHYTDRDLQVSHAAHWQTKRSSSNDHPR